MLNLKNLHSFGKLIQKQKKVLKTHIFDSSSFPLIALNNLLKLSKLTFQKIPRTLRESRVNLGVYGEIMERRVTKPYLVTPPSESNTCCSEVYFFFGSNRLRFLSEGSNPNAAALANHFFALSGFINLR